MTPFSMAGTQGISNLLAEAASPISSRPPAPPPPPAQQYDGGLMSGSGAGTGVFPDDDPLTGAVEESDRGGSAGNRWPRQETLALLKIRSDMDAAFRDATLKGPLWDEVSRKLAELGYTRSAKKCKEKFENVHKYYKRTKESRAGRQDGKAYRFFSQLEALGGVAPSAGAARTTALPVAAAPPAASTAFVQQAAVANAAAPAPESAAAAAAVGVAGLSCSSNYTSSSPSDESDEETEDMGGSREIGKRKRKGSSGSGSRKMMAFFQGLMKRVMEQQEAMQQRFLETIEKREQDRMIREEAWRRQEAARISREQEILAHERAIAASRDSVVISFIQKITGQSIPLPTLSAPAINVIPPPSPQQAPPEPPPQRSHFPHPQKSPVLAPQPPPPAAPQQHLPPVHQMQGTATDIIPVMDSGGFEPGPSSSRWPKTEVHALIKLRSDLEARYQEAGPKGPLWEEISAGMQRLGYNRNPKRCKEKWENINKYFKKVKESNKKRPEDSKTCPYFQQLDAIYRSKQQLGNNTSRALPFPHEANNPVPISMAPPSTQVQPQPSQQIADNESKIGGGADGAGGNGVSLNKQLPSNNGPNSGEMELVGQRDQHHQPYGDSDDMDQDEDEYHDDEDEDEEDGKMQYEIHFQRQNPSQQSIGAGNGGNARPSDTTGAAAGSAGSFTAMVQ